MRTTDRYAALNRRARHDYLIEDKLEAGLVLHGTEVKSLRQGGALRLALSGYPSNFNALHIDGNEADSGAMLRATMPRAFRVASDGTTTVNTDYFTNVELTSKSPQVVTYTINPKAVWSDGTPITWEDIASQINATSGKNKDFRIASTNGADRVEKVYYPTLDILPGSPKTMTFLAHSSVPITFTPEDFEQVDSGNFLVKVVYLPDLYYQDVAVVAGPNMVIIELGGDALFMKKLAIAPMMEVKAAQTTFKLPMTGFTAALAEVETCYGAIKQRVSNPFAPPEPGLKMASGPAQ